MSRIVRSGVQMPSEEGKPFKDLQTFALKIDEVRTRMWP